jgi:hypothetical protein
MTNRNPRRCGHCTARLGFLALAGALIWLPRALRRNVAAGRTC